MPLSLAHRWFGGWLLLFALLMVGCGQTLPDDVVTDASGRIHQMTGIASWYGKKFQGRKTASGEPFDRHKMTAAHRTLPFQTLVRVIDPETRKSVVVRINDRGPWRDERVIDLSEAAATDLDMRQRGLLHVRIEVLEWGDGARFSSKE